MAARRGVAEAAPPAPREPPCRAPPPERAAVPHPRVGIVVLADTASEARYVATQRYSQKSLDNKRVRLRGHHGYELHRARAAAIAGALVEDRRAAAPSPPLRLAPLSGRQRGLRREPGDLPRVVPRRRLRRRHGGGLGRIQHGAFFVRNSSFSHELLRKMADGATGKLDLARRRPWYAKTLPFEFEQRALHYLTDTASWRKWAARSPTEGAARVGRAAASHAVPHYKVVPQCALNQRLLSGRASRRARAPRLSSRAAYQPGRPVAPRGPHDHANHP